jgi:hypothetical protein
VGVGSDFSERFKILIDERDTKFADSIFIPTSSVIQLIVDF